MNEEQAVLDFFAQEENLPLALIAAEHLDAIRLRLNNEFWHRLREDLDGLLAQHELPWTSELTEDRNAEDCVVGLHLQPASESRVFLRPFMEQQFTGSGYRIYYGLIWSTAPAPEQKSLPAVTSLSAALEQDGFKQGDNFFAWQWLPWHPRRRDFLMAYSGNRDRLLSDVLQPWQYLLLACGEQLQLANLALDAPTESRANISLDQLRSKLPSHRA
ncbi:MAG TPA: hypothetical protein VIU46_06330 [Gallionellaceae bacterium]